MFMIIAPVNPDIYDGLIIRFVDDKGSVFQFGLPDLGYSFPPALDLDWLKTNRNLSEIPYDSEATS
jgi:hypothetical protein